MYNFLGIWCNSSTSDFDSDDMGANPVIPVSKKYFKNFQKSIDIKYWVCYN